MNLVQLRIPSAARHRGARRFPWPALRLTLRPGPSSHPRSLPSLATARIRPWPGPVIAPTVHGSACLRHLNLSFNPMTSRSQTSHPNNRWNIHPMFRRVETGLASVTLNARRLVKLCLVLRSNHQLFEATDPQSGSRSLSNHLLPISKPER